MVFYRLLDFIQHFPQDLIYRLQKGFWPSECWNLDYSIVKFTLLRLKEFRENVISYPLDITIVEWEGILDEIIWAMEHYSWEEHVGEEGRFDFAMKLFGKYFCSLWD